MRILVFNPEHDLALASNLDNFTAPHAGRELRHDLGFLPALWAESGDFVLVDNIEAALYAWRKLCLPTEAIFVTRDQLPRLICNTSFSLQPWGWDRAIREEFLRVGPPKSCLPNDAFLNFVRQTSHRSWAAEHILRPLRTIPGTIGEAETARSLTEIRRFLSVRHRIVLKAPWSSSGRGVRYVSDGTDGNTAATLTPQLKGWIKHILQRQGAVLMEPYYNKVMDLGMEFYSDGHGNVQYSGLSLFNTVKGAYTGNVLAPEEEKEQRVAQFLGLDTLNDTRQQLTRLLAAGLGGVYRGCLGVDMMLVSKDGTIFLHPCVEMNLRTTMGHVALKLREVMTKPWSTMRIVYKNGKYCLDVSEKRMEE